ncbi:ECF transporter S component [Kurthia sp. FSL E2-0154]|uniref:ECF transporter S component n=1 Tax=Kurthia sp. FSL E2-0154 TaxID=2921358 RepID=UPI0030FA0F22
MSKKVISLIIFFVIIPIGILIGATLLEDGKYNLISMFVMVFACIPFFLSFERRKPDAREVLIIAVMSAITVAGRAAFAFIPAFKPMTALVAITGFKLGPEAGFLTGAVSAVTSNILFGQGPWTPFQMFTLGILGYIAGLLGKTKWMESKISLLFYGIFSGIMYSMLMDIWTVLSLGNGFNWIVYGSKIITAIPFTITYMISNVIFLWLLTKPIGDKLERLKIKYGVMQTT